MADESRAPTVTYGHPRFEQDRGSFSLCRDQCVCILGLVPSQQFDGGCTLATKKCRRLLLSLFGMPNLVAASPRIMLAQAVRPCRAG